MNANPRITESVIEFQEVVASLEDTYVQGLQAFVTYLQATWQHQSRERYEKMFNDRYPGDRYRDGWNACLASLDGALAVFREEHRP